MATKDAAEPGAERWVPASRSISRLSAAAEDCRGCELYRDATQVVFGAGSGSARLMLVGEQPGDQEDRSGEPFVGPAGRLLDDALQAAGIPRSEVYLTNAVKHFRHHLAPRGKRRIHDKPSVAQVVACHPWLAAEVQAVRPELMVCLGATAARSVLGRPARIGAERGAVLSASDTGTGVAALITTHPSALLRVRDRPEWDEEFDRFVADLVVARSALRG